MKVKQDDSCTKPDAVVRFVLAVKAISFVFQLGQYIYCSIIVLYLAAYSSEHPSYSSSTLFCSSCPAITEEKSDLESIEIVATGQSKVCSHLKTLLIAI